MKDSEHIIKSSFLTAAGSFLIVVALPDDWVTDKNFTKFLAAIPPILVWLQISIWKHGPKFVEDEIVRKFKDWRVTRQVRKILCDPHIVDLEKDRLSDHYSKSKIDEVINLISSKKKEPEDGGV